MYNWKVEEVGGRLLQETLQSLTDNGYEIDSIIPPQPTESGYSLYVIIAYGLAAQGVTRLDEKIEELVNQTTTPIPLEETS